MSTPWSGEARELYLWFHKVYIKCGSGDYPIKIDVSGRQTHSDVRNTANTHNIHEMIIESYKNNS